MKVITWNVNSIRTRLDRLVALLARHRPDVVCLQELKVVDEDFPFAALEEAGYQAAVYGQKTYNGVAILSREPAVDIRTGFGDDDPQARLISASVNGVQVLSTYFPNGGEVGSDKYAYKLDWMKRLRSLLDRDYDAASPLLVCGDTNIALHDHDIAKPEKWTGSVLCTPEGRAALTDICAWGLRDVFGEKYPDGGLFSWWDYRQLAFPKGDGLRIDHILATATLADRCTAASIDRDERKGEKPSDHAPVIAEFDGF